MSTSHLDLNQLADRLRKCYQLERNRLTVNQKGEAGYRTPTTKRSGGPEGRGSSVWVKLARFCAKQKIDPIRYIQWSLSIDRVLLGQPPEPNQLLSPTTMNEYRRDQDKQRLHNSRRFNHEMDVARIHFGSYRRSFKPERAWAIVLVEPFLEISPLMRYCLATIFGGERFHKIADIWEARALSQYHRNPDAYACWPAGMIPVGFAKKAERQYDRLLEEEP